MAMHNSAHPGQALKKLYLERTQPDHTGYGITLRESVWHLTAGVAEHAVALRFVAQGCRQHVEGML